MSIKLSYWLTNKGLASIGLITAVSYFLFMEHRQHLVEYLPFIIILLCPLMHLFMHGGHGNHGGKHRKSEAEDAYQKGIEDGRKLTQTPARPKNDQ
jgi:carbon starvation protein CstA